MTFLPISEIFSGNVGLEPAAIRIFFAVITS